MAAPSLTYTLTNGQTADATQVMQNFNDLLNGYTDGTKDLSISALTCAGTVTLNGNVTLGNATGDDITVTGSLASTIPIKTTNTYNIGSSTLGLAGIYFGANSQTVRVIGSGSMSATWTLTLPTTAGSAGQTLQTNGSGVTSWTNNQTDVHSVSSADYTITNTDGYGTILVTTGASDRTITLPAAAAANEGRKILIKKIDSGAGDVLISGTIDGSSSTSYNCIKAQYGQGTIISDGSAWYWFSEIEENGTWTPTISFSTSNGTAALSGTQTYYRRQGRIIHITGRTLFTRGTGSGDFSLAGLPYNAISGEYFCDAGGLADRVTPAANYSTIVGVVGTSAAATISYYYRAVNAANTILAVNSGTMSASEGTIYFNLHYYIPLS